MHIFLQYENDARVCIIKYAVTSYLFLKWDKSVSAGWRLLTCQLKPTKRSYTEICQKKKKKKKETFCHLSWDSWGLSSNSTETGRKCIQNINCPCWAHFTFAMNVLQHRSCLLKDLFQFLTSTDSKVRPNVITFDPSGSIISVADLTGVGNAVNRMQSG